MYIFTLGGSLPYPFDFLTNSSLGSNSKETQT